MHIATNSIGITDEDQNRIAREAFAVLADHAPRAARGKAIVYVLPFRKSGIIELPDDCKPNSVEAVMWHDNTGYGIQRGTRMMIHPKVGLIWKHHGVELVTIPASAMIAIEEVAEEAA